MNKADAVDDPELAGVGGVGCEELLSAYEFREMRYR